MTGQFHTSLSLMLVLLVTVYWSRTDLIKLFIIIIFIIIIDHVLDLIDSDHSFLY